MIVLGFDTSTRATAVALRLPGGVGVEARDDPPAGAHPGHATRLLDMAGRLLSDAGIAWSEVDRIAVGLGPGTFTGLRVGVATARGLAQSLGVELVGVPSTLALAMPALASERLDAILAADGREGAVLAAIDARRGEVFAAVYEADEQGTPRELAAPLALPPQAISSAIAEATDAAGGESLSLLAVGDGAVRFRAELQDAGAHVEPDSSPLHLLSANAICALGELADARGLQEILPDYRRRPDAELALEGSTAAGGA
jgi:tRNA threonylcarbamoyladenosine biosynthesis protein TsaB